MSLKSKLGNDWGRLDMTSELSSLCSYAKGKVSVDTLSKRNYVSTENMVPNKGGIVDAGALPSAQYTQQYIKDDILVSNIRPYFKKIWMADDDGGCSNDVLVFRAECGCDSTFLYYVLANDAFFNYASATSKGTKMPRGDKTAIMQYEVPCFNHETQLRIGKLLRSIDDRITVNKKINDNLHQQAATLFKALFVDLTPFDGTMPPNWTISTLGDATKMGAGGDKPKESSPVKTPLCPYPIYSNGINDYGLYGYTNDPKIKVESVTVSARGTIGYVCLRHTPYVPIVRLVTLIPDTKVLSAKYLYLYLRQLHITGTGTTQQQLTVPDFRKTEIIIPDKNTMDSFTETVTPLFEQIWENEDENTKLAEVRDALLPKLMSGEIDVSDIQL